MVNQLKPMDVQAMVLHNRLIHTVEHIHSKDIHSKDIHNNIAHNSHKRKFYIHRGRYPQDHWISTILLHPQREVSTRSLDIHNTITSTEGGIHKITGYPQYYFIHRGRYPQDHWISTILLHPQREVSTISLDIHNTITSTEESVHKQFNYQ